MAASERRGNASTAVPRLFVDDCSLCGGNAYFTGRFTEADAAGWQSALFYCDRCRETYRVWRQGLAEYWREQRPWILLRHDPAAPCDPIPLREFLPDRRTGLEWLWHAAVEEGPNDPEVRGHYTLFNVDEVVTLPDAPETMERLRLWTAGASAERDPESPVLAALARRHDELLAAGRDATELIEIIRFCRNRRALIDALGGAGPREGERSMQHSGSPLRTSGWTLHAHDLFDRQDSPQVVASGLELVPALRLLWYRTLNERIGPAGERLFTGFQLWRGANRTAVPDDLPALAKLRAWAEDDATGLQPEAPLIARIAAVHSRLWLRGREPSRITELAASSIDRRTFELRLDDIDPG